MAEKGDICKREAGEDDDESFTISVNRRGSWEGRRTAAPHAEQALDRG